MRLQMRNTHPTRMNFLKKILFGTNGSTDVVTVKHLNVPSQYLERGVKVDIFLPPQYGKDKNVFYPTIYFNDGQDMLALGMFETLTRLYRDENLPHCIIVAAYCNDNRMNEYGTANRPDYKNRGNKARQYNDFVIHELVPYIQSEYKCKKTHLETTYAGFSLGALSAFDIAWANPSVFGKAGVFSGSLWWRDREWTQQDPDGGRIMHDIINKSTHQAGMKFWFEVGTKDEECDRNNNGVIDAIDDTLEIINELVGLGYRPHEDIKYVEIDGGEHNPQTWGKIMPDFLNWVLK
jgi:iron(III)-enterobactin esterase